MTPESGDGALLDYFSIRERTAALYPQMRAGTVNLNTPHAPVMAALLRGAAKNTVSISEGFSIQESDETAATLIATTRAKPLQSLADLSAIVEKLGGVASGSESIKRRVAIAAIGLHWKIPSQQQPSTIERAHLSHPPRT